MTILVTGGTGYIGSHTVVELLNQGYEVVIVDSLVNSSEVVLKRIEAITGKIPAFYKVELTDQSELRAVFKKHEFDAVIHFAALKSVGESVANPLQYYQNNLVSLLNLIGCLKDSAVENLIFSSSATVYGEPEEVPLTEHSQIGIGITNPYGQTKFMSEQILKDYAHANPKLNVTLLRYFNPAGAHESGMIGEDPNDTPNNLMPYVSQVAIGKLPELQVFGGDYNTKDGTGVRDYIHVVDLAKGHLQALARPNKSTNLSTYNLGTGQGYSVLEIIAAFEQASGKKIAYKITNRRPGDIAECYADPTQANKKLDWKATKTLAQMCEDAWRWQSQNPNGYTDQ